MNASLKYQIFIQTKSQHQRETPIAELYSESYLWLN